MMSKWIDIKEKSPPEKTFNSVFIVTMFSHSKLKNFVLPLHYIDGEWFTMFEEDPLNIAEYEVTHWMELPEVPLMIE